MKFHFIFLIVFLSYPSVKADNYYVSNSGSNLENGSASDPWETLQYAADNIDDGDTVFVLPGDYAGFYMDASGSEISPIVFKALQGATITSRNEITQDAINLEAANYIVINGFTITNDGGTIERAGIRSVANTGVVIINNTISNMGRWGIFTGFSESIVIENNSCSYSQAEHGIYHSNSADNPVIKGNICFGNHGCGIHMNGDLSMGGDGIISNALIQSNIIYNNGEGGGSGINCDGVQNSKIRNNLLYNNHASGISLYQTDGAEGAINNYIVNNTIVMPSDGRWAINIANESTGNTLYNNILFTDHSFRGGLSLDESSLPGTVSNYNVMVDRFSLDWGDTRITLEEWQGETGQDLNSYIATPEETFVGVHNNDYHLVENCDAVDNGTNLFGPMRDLDNQIRPQGNGYDVGAYEYSVILGIVTPVESYNPVLIYPNPALDYFRIQSEESIDKIEIIEREGKIIRTIAMHSQKNIDIPTEGLKKGFHFIRLFSGRNMYCSSLFIQ